MTSTRPTAMLPPPADTAPAEDIARIDAHRRRIVARLQGLAGHLPADSAAAHAVERDLVEIDYYVDRAALHLGLVRAGGA